MNDRHTGSSAEEDVTSTKEQTQGASDNLSYGPALLEVIRNLKDYPILLFTIGAAIVLVGGAQLLKIEVLQELMVPLLVLLLAGLAAGLFIETRKGQGARSVQGAKSGDIIVRRGTRQENSEGTTGDVSGKGQSGNIDYGGNTSGTTHTTGNVSSSDNEGSQAASDQRPG